MTAGGPLLVVDTATTVAVVAIGTLDGELTATSSWTAGYRHGEELLARVEALLGDARIEPAALGGLVVGTGPGAFTGLRVGLATIKGLAYALGLPVAGVSTGEALLAAATAAAGGGDGAPRLVLVQPAGPSDRVLTRAGEQPRILPGGIEPDLRDGEALVAVDLADRAPAAAVARGEAARGGLAAALLEAGSARLRLGHADDLARLVPEYVTLPRGVLAPPTDGGVAVTGGEAAR